MFFVNNKTYNFTTKYLSSLLPSAAQGGGGFRPPPAENHVVGVWGVRAGRKKVWNRVLSLKIKN